MRAWAGWLYALASLSGAAGPAQAQQPCPPMEQTVAQVVATETRARSDVTDRFRCYFPVGMSFNDAAILLDSNKFDLLNKKDPMFYLWPARGEEFVSRRMFQTFWTTSEIRITVHTVDRRITQVAAQYMSGGQ